MPDDDTKPSPEQESGTRHEDGPIPSASDDKVLDETTRLAREGRKELESDPKERKPASE